MKGIEFERLVIEALVKITKQKGFRHSPLAKKAWPYKASADVSWRLSRNGGRRLNIGEAYDLAQTLNISFLDLMAIVHAKTLE